MKKVLLRLCTFLMLAGLMVGMAVPVSADSVVSGMWGDLTWELNQTTGHLIISGNGEMEDFTFSNSAAWRSYESSVKSVTIEDGVTSIGGEAFMNCSNLTSITIPNSVTSIGGSRIFENCSNLTSITIPEGVTIIGSSAFEDCSNLTSITIPESVIIIGSNAFKNCSSLTSITIPESVTRIDFNAFNGSDLFQEENGVLYVDKWVTGCYNYVTNMSLRPDTVGIVTYAFEDERNLISVTIPESVKSISFYAFSGCSSLSNITIPEGVTSIASCAFLGCSSLTNITIPKSMESIGASAFYGTDLFQIENGVSYVDKWVVDCDPSVINVSLRSNTEGIAACAFKDNSNLIDITIPNGVTAIGEDTFYGCSSLSSIAIPEGVTSIGSYAFYKCSSLPSITIPNSVTSIGGRAFERCGSLTNVTLPDTVTSIGDSAFRLCTNLTAINIPGGISTITDGAFESCSSLKNVEITEGVTTIEDHAFLGCSGIINLKLPNGIITIGKYAFQGCSGLVNIEIPNSVISIGEEAFGDCSRSLEKVVVQSGNENYHSDGNCLIETKSKTLILGCKNSIIPTDGSVKKIGNQAFWGCKGLKEIQIPKSVTSIGESAFGNCTQIKNVIYLGTEEQWNAVAKGEDWNEYTTFEIVFQLFAGNTGNVGTESGDSDIFDADGDLIMVDNYNSDEGVNIPLVIAGGVATAGIGGASIWWFAIKKKKFSDLVKLVKKP